jgi:Pyruvate/2-oxoacid:ferredoxin oxidoreductase delta subunit
MRMTGAVKNQFGCIPGMSKASFHLKLQDPADFGRMLAALTLCLKPRLYVMDGIVAMEGNGPSGGDPRPMNALLFSTDPIALDAVMCRLAALDPTLLSTNLPGREWGLGTYRDDEIDLVGDPIGPLVNGDFSVNRGKPHRQMPASAGFIVKHFVAPRPVIDQGMCSRCGTCIQVCPVTPKAVDWRDGSRSRPPKHFYDRCIRCYCCQEVCPEKAISVRRGLFGS